MFSAISANPANGSVPLTQYPLSTFITEQPLPLFSTPPPITRRSPSQSVALVSKQPSSVPNSYNAIPIKNTKYDETSVMNSLENLIDSGEIIEMAKTKDGSRLLHKMLPIDNDQLRSKLYATFIQKDAFYNLCGDPNGNFLMQKLIDQSTPAEQSLILNIVKGHLTTLGCHRYSTRVVQKLWTKVDNEWRISLLDELKEKEIDIAIDLNGTHLVQKIIETTTVDVYGCIVETFVSTNVRLRIIAEDRNGCRVLQLIIEKLASEALQNDCELAKSLLEKIMNGVMRNFKHFVDHQFANYVIQYIISTQNLGRYAKEAIRKLSGNLLILSQEKYASHVVERALECGNEQAVSAIMDEIFNGYQCDSDGVDALEILLFDQFGNYVVQKMFEIAIEVRQNRREGNIQWFDIIAERISQRSKQISRYSSGKRLIDRLQNVTQQELFGGESNTMMIQ